MGLFDFLRKKKPADPPPFARSGPVIGFTHADAILVSGFSAEDGFPFPVQRVSGERAQSVMLRLRSMQPDMGASPVILGKPDGVGLLFDCWGDPYDYERELRAAQAFDVEAWAQKRREEDREIFEDPENDQGEIFAAESAPMTSLQAGFDHRGQAYPRVLLALIPALEPWQIPLHFRFGGWNSCPEPHVHAALARRWQEKYGAVISTVSFDIIEFTVERPPTTDEEALALAWEQFLYCEDIVTQGVGSVATLAKALRHSTCWFFWWD